MAAEVAAEAAAVRGKADAADVRTRGRRLADLGIFTGIFAVTLGLAARFFIEYGKSNIWAVDGTTAHFPMLYYFNLWVRRIVYNFPDPVALWSWDVGLGADTIGTLTWPVLGDPFAVVSLLMPMAQMELAYALAFVARLLAGGLASFAYLRVMKARPLAATAGALIYVFTMYAMHGALRHPYFANTLVFLPFVLIGIERALKGRRPWVLVLAVFGTAVSNYYFFYMITIIAVLYAVLRYVEVTPTRDRRRVFLPTVARVGGLYLLGTLMASVTLLPSAAAFLASGRTGGSASTGLFYTAWEYIKLLQRLTSGLAPSATPYTGFSIIGVLLLPILFVRRGNFATKVMLALFPVFVVLPFFGSLFNGMSDPTGRFTFAWGLFIALGAALVLSDDTPLTRREILTSAGFLGVYLAVLFATGSKLTEAVLFPFVVGAIGLGVLVYERGFQAGGDSPGGAPRRIGRYLGEDWESPWTRWVLAALVIAGIGGNAMYLYDLRYQNTLTSWEDQGTVLARYLENPGMIAQELPKGDFYRVEKQEHVGGMNVVAPFSNDPLVQKYRGTAAYNSLMSGYLMSWMDEIQNRNRRLPFSYFGFDDRVGPTTLLGVRYYIATVGWRQYVPYGFKRMDELSTDDHTVYENEHALPLGFVYDGVVRRSTYESLDALGKQQVLLEAAVVEDDALVTLPERAPRPRVIEVPYSVEPTEGVIIDTAARTITTTEPQASARLIVQPVEDAELYVELRKLDFDAQSPLERASIVLGEEPTRLDRLALAYRYRFFDQPSDYTFRYVTTGRSKAVRRYRDDHLYAWGDHTHLVNLGYQKSGADSVTITFDGIGSGTYEALHVWAVPMVDYEEKVADLQAMAMTDIEVGTNRVTGRVSSDTDGLLFLSIPYSQGWTAKVDGEPVETLRVNTAFTGVPVTAGGREVTLAYVTPGLREGRAVSGLALVVFAGVMITDRRRRSRGRRNASDPARDAL
ncbi:MAG: YfhO family protein [Coriobacteriia bacterium]|nr:YfhO family protein [Coriobacteriia bacterium]